MGEWGHWIAVRGVERSVLEQREYESIAEPAPGWLTAETGEPLWDVEDCPHRRLAELVGPDGAGACASTSDGDWTWFVCTADGRTAELVYGVEQARAYDFERKQDVAGVAAWSASAPSRVTAAQVRKSVKAESLTDLLVQLGLEEKDETDWDALEDARALATRAELCALPTTGRRFVQRGSWGFFVDARGWRTLRPAGPWIGVEGAYRDGVWSYFMMQGDRLDTLQHAHEGTSLEGARWGDWQPVPDDVGRTLEAVARWVTGDDLPLDRPWHARFPVLDPDEELRGTAWTGYISQRTERVGVVVHEELESGGRLLVVLPTGEVKLAATSAEAECLFSAVDSVVAPNFGPIWAPGYKRDPFPRSIPRRLGDAAPALLRRYRVT